MAQIKPAPIASPQKQTDPFMTADWLDESKKFLKVCFWFPKGDGRFTQALSVVKSLPDRAWNSTEKFWKVGACREAALKLSEFGFEFSQSVKDWAQSFCGSVATEMEGIDVPGIKGTLMPFQRQGIAFINDRKGRALVGDEMGLGKTIQALGYLQLHPELRPALICCPASLKRNWHNEILKWLPSPGKIQVLQGRFDKKKNCDVWGDFVIANYDILSNSSETKIVPGGDGKPKKKKVEVRDTGWADFLCKRDFKAIIMDEIHYNKESKTLRTKACKRLAHNWPAGALIGLSGTPIVNRTIEFYNAISFIRPDLFPSYWKFAHQYTHAKNNGFGWKFEGSKNGEELHKILTETIMIRRKKSEVLQQLPPKVWSIVPFDIDNRRAYDVAASDIIGWIAQTQGAKAAKKAKQAEALIEFEKLKQLAVAGKMAAVISWVAEFLDSGQKLVVFATHKKTLDILEDKFRDISVRIDGSTPQGKRQEIVDSFQEKEEARLFLGNIKAAGVGLTLTAASNVAFVELPWTPGDLEQAADRCHRIGQKDTVNAWVLIAEDTIEDTIAAILSQKQKTLDKVLDGKDTEEGTVLIDLINKLKPTDTREAI